MTLLSKGIGNTGGLGSLDTLITKLQADKKEVENNVDVFNNNLYGVKSSMNYVGEKGKSILQSYNTAIEGLMDQYAANPSDELEKKISELVVQAKDFSNKAVAERQTGIEQLNAIIANPEAYDTTVEEARRAFTERYDTPVNAMFDFESNEVLLDSEAGKVRLGAYGQYNGEDPFYIPKRSEMQIIKTTGEWATANKDLFNLNSESLGEDVSSSFIKTARYDDSLATTAVYNFLNDIEKVNLAGMSETAVSKAVQDVLNDPDRFNSALEYQGKKESEKLTGYVTSANDKAFQKEWDKTFTGGVNDLDNDPMYESFSMRDGMTNPSDYVAPNAGVFMTYDLKTPIGSSLVTAMNENSRIVSFNVDEIGRFHVVEEQIVENEDGEEITQEVEKVYEAGSDVYNSLKNIIPAQARQKMQQNAAQRADAYRTSEQQRRFETARKNAERAKSEADIIRDQPLTKPMTEEQKAAETAKVVSDIGLNSPVSAQQTQGAFDATTYGGQPILRDVAEQLVDKGYNAEQIKSALQSKRFEEILKREDVSVEQSALRRTASSIADVAFGWMGYESKMSRNKDRMVELAEQEIIQRQSDKAFAVEADARKEEREAPKNIVLTPAKTQEEKYQNYDMIRSIAEEEGFKFPDAVAKQFALESAYGTRLSGENNYFGIKYTPRMERIFRENGIDTSAGEAVSTQEVLPNGERVTIQDQFFNFPSTRDGVKAYMLFVENNPRYGEALQADSTREYLNRLGEAGYATEPDYGRKVYEVGPPESR